LWLGIQGKIESRNQPSFPDFQKFLEDIEELCFGDIQIVTERYLDLLAK